MPSAPGRHASRSEHQHRRYQEPTARARLIGEIRREIRQAWHPHIANAKRVLVLIRLENTSGCPIGADGPAAAARGADERVVRSAVA